MAQFSDKQMMAAIQKEGIVKDSYMKLQEICQILKTQTGCPDEDIDSLLNFLIGRWQKGNFTN